MHPKVLRILKIKAEEARCDASRRDALNLILSGERKKHINSTTVEDISLKRDSENKLVSHFLANKNVVGSFSAQTSPTATTIITTCNKKRRRDNGVGESELSTVCCTGEVANKNNVPLSTEMKNNNRSERKRDREKKRRFEVNKRFGELLSLLLEIDPELETEREKFNGGGSSSKYMPEKIGTDIPPGGGNFANNSCGSSTATTTEDLPKENLFRRVDLIHRTCITLKRLHTENEGRRKLIEELLKKKTDQKDSEHRPRLPANVVGQAEKDSTFSGTRPDLQQTLIHTRTEETSKIRINEFVKNEYKMDSGGDQQLLTKQYQQQKDKFTLFSSLLQKHQQQHQQQQHQQQQIAQKSDKQQIQSMLVQSHPFPTRMTSSAATAASRQLLRAGSCQILESLKSNYSQSIIPHQLSQGSLICASNHSEPKS